MKNKKKLEEAIEEADKGETISRKGI